METIFGEIGLIIIVSALLGLVAKIFKQPLILAYIVAGILLGPILGFISNQNTISILAHFGVALLLFLVGLELDIRKLKNLGIITLILALGQIVFTFGIFFVLLRFFHLDIAQIILWSFGLTLSSTVIVIKILSEKHDLHSLSGRILIGILLFQDLIAIFGIIFLNSFSFQDANSISIYLNLGITILKGLGFILAAGIFTKYILPKTFQDISKNQELLFLSAISWCFALGLLAVLCGFSLEIGAFIAGITLAPLPYSVAIVGKIKPLRDFFITIFFVALGMQINFSNFGSNHLLLIILLLLGILIIKPLVVMIFMGLLGYKSRTSFRVGIGLAQISEFSFVAFALAKNYSLISSADLSIIIILGILSIAISTYLINHVEILYRTFKSFFKLFEFGQFRREEIIHTPEELKNHIIIFGCRRTGEKILRTLKKLSKKVLVVDYDPEIVHRLKEQNIPCIFGDMADLELLERLGLEHAEMIISTVDNEESNHLMLQTVHKKHAQALICIFAHELSTAIDLYKRGAHEVIIPRILGGEWLAEKLRQVKGEIKALPSSQNKDEYRQKHLQELKSLVEKGL